MDTTPTPATIAAGVAVLKEQANEFGFGFAINSAPEDKLEAFVTTLATAILKAQAAQP